MTVMAKEIPLFIVTVPPLAFELGLPEAVELPSERAVEWVEAGAVELVSETMSVAKGNAVPVKVDVKVDEYPTCQYAKLHPPPPFPSRVHDSTTAASPEFVGTADHA
ncbi:hypothetical protein BDQ12DRAFT_687436 [Crucibulum laeve]|uniref:Uncharacterized protein n=1 Tax=Crucibulum laeve TaxID=68775 RepID=A0A5C3LRY2_9AGAR|nr:hypothetical protein BDQ12DRAFT_687436 [Crucibulum laeve]